MNLELVECFGMKPCGLMKDEVALFKIDGGMTFL
jgi:hypothetical protein